MLPFEQRLDHLIGGNAIGPQSIRIGADNDRSLASPKWRRCTDAFDRSEHRPDLEEGLILNLPDGFGFTREHQITDRHRTSVKPHDEWIDRARGHKGPGTIDVPHRFGHGLSHVRAGVEIELHQRHALDVLRFDVVNAVDVEEVILVVVGDQPFHLLRVHSAVGLRDVDDR